MVNDLSRLVFDLMTVFVFGPRCLTPELPNSSNS
jgi:hypothetical protein